MTGKHPLSETLFAKIFKTAVGKDYLLSFQWDARSRSRFMPLNRGLKNLFLLAISSALAGLLCLVAELGYWSFNKLSYKYQREHNARLRAGLSEIAAVQEALENGLDSLTAFESRIRALYGLNTLDGNLRLFGIGGRRPEPGGGDPGNPVYERITRLSFKYRQMQSRLDFTRNNLAQIQEHVKYKHDLWEHTPSVIPAKGRITSGFGYRLHPVTGRNTLHEGIDIANSQWTPIYASADGLVVRSGVNGNFGKLVVLDHGNGYSTKYGHLTKTMVEKGQMVRRYALIGYMGSTGRVTGTHLHYEVHRDGAPQNPSKYILPSGVVID